MMVGNGRGRCFVVVFLEGEGEWGLRFVGIEGWQCHPCGDGTRRLPVPGKVIATSHSALVTKAGLQSSCFPFPTSQLLSATAPCEAVAKVKPPKSTCSCMTGEQHNIFVCSCICRKTVGHTQSHPAPHKPLNLSGRMKVNNRPQYWTEGNKWWARQQSC